MRFRAILRGVVTSTAMAVVCLAPTAGQAAEPTTQPDRGSAVCTVTSKVTLTYDDRSMRPKEFAGKAENCTSTAGAAVQDMAVAAVHQFTPADPFYAHADSNGTFSAQVTYATRSLPVAFGYQISPALQAIATSTVTASITETRTACHYSKVGAPVDYPFHWYCPTHSAFTNYSDNGTFVFRWANGTVTITISFSYNINLGGPAVATP